MEDKNTSIPELERKIAELQTQLDHAEKIRGLLFRISRAASLTENLGELLENIRVELGTVVDTTNFFVALYYEDSGLYSFPVCVDEFEEEDIFFPQELKNSLTDFVRRTGEPLLADKNVHYELIRLGEVEMVGTPSKSWMGVPLLSPLGIIGVVVVQSYRDEKAYSREDLNLLTFVSENIAMAIEHKRAEDELNHVRDHLDSIVEERTEHLKTVNDQLKKELSRLRKKLG